MRPQIHDNRRYLALRTARKIAKLTQQELADRVGVDHSFISLLESGARDINTVAYETVVRIAWTLHVTPDELFPLIRDLDRFPVSAEERASS